MPFLRRTLPALAVLGMHIQACHLPVAAGQTIVSGPATATQFYTYDAYGNLVALPGAGNALTSLLYSGELTDATTGLQYLRARFYDPTTGRFTRFDPNTRPSINDPISLHKYLYASGNAVMVVDPSGEFSVAELGSVSGIQNTIVAATNFIGRVYKAYNTAKKIIEILNFAKSVVGFFRALHVSTPQGAAVALASEFRRQFGAENGNAIIQGFGQVFDWIGPDWEKIAKRINEEAFTIAGEVAIAIAPNMPRYIAQETAGDLQFILFAPTAPGPHKGDKIFSIGKRAAVGVAPTGGRLFGFGVRAGKQSGFDQWFRIDYYDMRLHPPLSIHYHVFGDTESHPEGRGVIWHP